MNDSPLINFLPKTGITIIGGYTGDELVAYVALYELRPDNTLDVNFPKGHPFREGQEVTLHLDNRTGVDEYDADLRVYRVSYKGAVTLADSCSVRVRPVEFMLFYSSNCVSSFAEPGYGHEDFPSPLVLPESPLRTSTLDWDERERENKLGVLITRLPSRPHTSLMAFLSGRGDDIFLITLRNTFKSRALHYDRRCCFAIDHRAEYVFEKAYDWNYTVVSSEVFGISKDNPLYTEVQYQFVMKNPWESSFFLSPDIEMFHLKPQKIILPDDRGKESK